MFSPESQGRGAGKVKKRKKEGNIEGVAGGEGKPKMSKTELLDPIAKYYIIDSQSGYKQNVSLEQNRIQKLEKLFSGAGTAMLCPASGAGGGSSPLVPLSLTPFPGPPALSARPRACVSPQFAPRAAGRTVLRGCLYFTVESMGDCCCPGQAAGSPGSCRKCFSLRPRPPLPWARLRGAAAGRARGPIWEQGPFSAAHLVSAGYPGLRRLPPSIQLLAYFHRLLAALCWLSMHLDGPDWRWAGVTRQLCW